MADQFAGVLAALGFENQHLLVAALYGNLGGYLGAGHQRGADLDGLAANHQHFAEFNGVAYQAFELLDLEKIAFGDLVLFATCLDNCVHSCVPPLWFLQSCGL